jgi:uncharacterized protein GlcG (DUF336 family)
MSELTSLQRPQPTVTLDAALSILAGCRLEAAELGRALAMVVVDPGGNVVASQRMDGAQLVAMELATDKAYTAIACGEPTELWGECTQPGGSDWGLALSARGRFIVFAGGLPLKLGGVVVGALGISGGPSDVDRACGLAGIVNAGFDAV